MAKRYFLASVGNAEGFKAYGDNVQHILSARTLTDSSIGFSVSMEEVRAGQGAKLYGRFSHTSNMTIGLTDAMFDLEYIALQTGSEKGYGASVVHRNSTTVKVTNGACTIEAEPVAIGSICGLGGIPIWFVKASSQCQGQGDEYSLALTSDNIKNAQNGYNITGMGTAVPDGDYCVSYFTHEAAAEFVKVSANFVPSEMILVLTAQLFEGDANAPETGKAAGTVVIKVPRYQLDGQFDLAMNMTSAAPISLNGVALAVDGGSNCEDKGYYAEIVQYTEGSDWRENLVDIISDKTFEVGGAIPHIYGVYANGSLSLLDNKQIANQKYYDAENNTEVAFNGFRSGNGPINPVDNVIKWPSSITTGTYVVIVDKNKNPGNAPYLDAKIVETIK